ncbi:sulfate adenylyltransferase subunit CysD [Buchnera aphidicola]|uniref:Sulfate adenylyltransferase subunit 2 n=1 Tax=Buchnera aphidicola str. USDA (Myzus persicae) TaxID=1009856 RepID=W0NZP4_BUCMP|nr:sulfate adenylyltransferase subunit CysD [Buchnera aphidicola]AHG59971.1 Cysd [Buchnera aphidicola str. USDA (Myzus persicae)]AHG60551.1 Cysd [Buchnera aphidicola str. W106 (Myzus persicae)]AHG61124.1 Cysd [Buchnera aphidicola str. G002 (Myzus persicae)]AHG61696.1 Cysd [Buchnera aphidicola str. F009 (Myzus persicae)]WAI03347.1 MAG: sulfate adenylyltransferase subunit CysD [Buchnera aphidicola (Myzus persicae)]
MFTKNTSHLRQLESESIYIMREVMSEFHNPVMLYSIGKDSSVMLHLAKKAFYPGSLPFPLLHIDTGWKFKEMYIFRDHIASTCNLELIVHCNSKGKLLGLNPFEHGGSKYTDIMKTEGLKEAINKYNFDAAFGGARRDEEKSRSKERIYSFRDSFHQWDPKKQRPELWWNYNGQINKGENIRVFPLSNWTELDIWQYIFLENIEIVPLYFAALRPVLKRDRALIMIDDERMNVLPNEVIQKKMVRFRTLGCWPLTSAIESEAKNLEDVIQETLTVKTSERTGRAIDYDQKSSMEFKKRQGYF